MPHFSSLLTILILVLVVVTVCGACMGTGAAKDAVQMATAVPVAQSAAAQSVAAGSWVGDLADVSSLGW